MVHQSTTVAISRLENARLRSVFSFSNVYEEQLGNVVENYSKTLVVSILVVGIVVLAFEGSPLAGIAILWGAAAIVLTAVSFIHARACNYCDFARPNTARVARYCTAFASLRGLHWAVGLATLMPAASAELQFMLGWVILGMASGGAFAYWSLPSAAISYVAMVGLGGFVGLVLTGSTASLLMSFALVLYCAYLLKHVLTSAALLRLNVETKQNLEDSRTDVGLLLQHFEQDSSDWIWEAGPDLKHKRNLQRFVSALSLPTGADSSPSWRELLLPFLKNEEQLKGFESFENAIVTGQDGSNFTLTFGETEDEKIWQISSHTKKRGDGTFAGWHGVVSDVTDQRRAEARVLHFAHHDALTNLPNRNRFGQLYEDAVKSRDFSACSSHLLYIDLDGFKAVNDTLGHFTGDQLLKAVTARLQQLLGPSDVLARQGGDEFLVLHHSDKTGDSAFSLARDICTVLSNPFKLYEQQILIGASIGLTQVGKENETLTEVLRHADLALYRAKAEGRNQFKVYEEAMDKLERDRQTLKIDMRKALVEGQFRLHYQPIVATHNRTVVAYEALLRWQHPTRGNVPPMDFIPLAEENGFIVDLGAWVLHHACKQAAQWEKHIRVCVNLSAVQIRSKQILPTVVKALADSHLPPHRLELEVTETSLVEDKDAAFNILRALKDLGVNISLDDFGTGYSSLAYLHEFPFDKIKIDRSFVQSCDDRKQSAAVVNAVLGLASELGMSTVAEGIETEVQLALLSEKGCDEVQGYFIGKPKSASELFSASDQITTKVA